MISLSNCLKVLLCQLKSCELSSWVTSATIQSQVNITESTRTDILSAIDVRKWFDDIGYAVVPLAFTIIQISELNITV